jgi:hypothetical protein
VTVTGIFEHMRDQACLTTSGVIQDMFARIKANANGEWYETYDRLRFRARGPEPGAPAFPLLMWPLRASRERWAVAAGPAAEAFGAGDGDRIRLRVEAESADAVYDLDLARRREPPPSPRASGDEVLGRRPRGDVLCSPRVWEELGYRTAPALAVDPWQEEALYAYFYFDGLRSASRGREQLRVLGFETYMPIDRFQGLQALAGAVTLGALVLLATVLAAGLLGILITLYIEVEAEEREIGLFKALGASNRVVALTFLGKGALMGGVGALFGIPLMGLSGG